ncbi:unnamed protein product, partial [Polarella glacialis]
VEGLGNLSILTAASPSPMPVRGRHGLAHSSANIPAWSGVPTPSRTPLQTPSRRTPQKQPLQPRARQPGLARSQSLERGISGAMSYAPPARRPPASGPTGFFGQSRGAALRPQSHPAGEFLAVVLRAARLRAEAEAAASNGLGGDSDAEGSGGAIIGGPLPEGADANSKLGKQIIEWKLVALMLDCRSWQRQASRGRQVVTQPALLSNCLLLMLRTQRVAHVADGGGLPPRADRRAAPKPRLVEGGEVFRGVRLSLRHDARKAQDYCSLRNVISASVIGALIACQSSELLNGQTYSCLIRNRPSSNWSQRFTLPTQPYATLCVQGIKDGVTNEALESHFEVYGRVRDVSITQNKHMKGATDTRIAIVEFAKKEDARRAMQGLNGRSLCGKCVMIRFARFDAPLRGARAGFPEPVPQTASHNKMLMAKFQAADKSPSPSPSPRRRSRSERRGAKPKPRSRSRRRSRSRGGGGRGTSLRRDRSRSDGRAGRDLRARRRSRSQSIGAAVTARSRSASRWRPQASEEPERSRKGGRGKSRDGRERRAKSPKPSRSPSRKRRR